ncbi:hypothetical protein LIER_40085 [Lithospermum erythrorhizon]|uniref:SHSP domain-containing protein n=1 Tax=Lithospermum erythrorhizon TaxID=34254 RepID=A0AAV3QQW7_LITER
MDATRGSSAATPIYEDFVPKSDVIYEDDCDTLRLHLPGFKKEQMRVQLTRGILRISGSMLIGANRMRRFQKEFPISQNCDTNKITAKFDNGILHVKQPKLITQATPSTVKQEHHKLPPTPLPSAAAQEPNKKHINELHATHANGKEVKENEGGNKLSRNDEKDKVATVKGDGGMFTRTENYGKMVDAMGKRLKMQRRVVHVLLGALFTCIIAIYLNNLITSYRQPKN